METQTKVTCVSMLFTKTHFCVCLTAELSNACGFDFKKKSLYALKEENNLTGL